MQNQESKPGEHIHCCVYGLFVTFAGDGTRQRQELLSSQPVSLTTTAIFRLQIVQSEFTFNPQKLF